MFMGAVLATIKSMEDRQMMCDAAMGYSFTTDRVLEKQPRD